MYLFQRVDPVLSLQCTCHAAYRSGNRYGAGNWNELTSTHILAHHAAGWRCACHGSLLDSV